MQKPSCIVINAFSRGGSNILWNVMQSHPSVCSPILETRELLRRHIFRWTPLLPVLLRHNAVVASPLGVPCAWSVRRGLNRWKMKNYGHPDNGTKSDGVLYTEDEVAESVLCVKSLDEDVEYSTLFRSIFDDVRFLCLVRDGYALCNGWKRRGMSPDAAGRRYARVTDRMLQLCDEYEGSAVFKFEELIGDPFAYSQRLYSFCSLTPDRLPKLRLKSKRVLSSNGRHEARFGEENRKYWLAPDEISVALDDQVNERQSAQVNDADRAVFDKHAHENMKRLGYA